MDFLNNSFLTQHIIYSPNILYIHPTSAEACLASPSLQPPFPRPRTRIPAIGDPNTGDPSSHFLPSPSTSPHWNPRRDAFLLVCYARRDAFILGSSNRRDTILLVHDNRRDFFVCDDRRDKLIIRFFSAIISLH